MVVISEFPTAAAHRYREGGGPLVLTAVAGLVASARRITALNDASIYLLSEVGKR